MRPNSTPPHNPPTTPPTDNNSGVLELYEIIYRAYRAEMAKAAAVLYGQTPPEESPRTDDTSKA